MKAWLNYLFKVNNGNTRTMCEIYSKLTKKTPKRRQWRRSGIFVVNFEQISHIVLVLPFLTLKNVNECWIQKFSFQCLNPSGTHFSISCHWSLSIPSENTRNQRFSDVFRGYKKRPKAWNRLITLLKKCNRS